MIRVAVVDDQELVRAGFRALLDSDPGIEVVAEAGNGVAAVAAVEATDPDVVLMDIRMPQMDGIEATRRIAASGSRSQVLILTTFDTDANVFDALDAGAVGFLVKDTPPVQMLEAVRAAAAGGSVISPSTTRRLIDHLVAARMASRRQREWGPEPPVAAVGALDALTERERDVLLLIARGCSNREIASRLHIAEFTAKTHVSRVLTKLGLQSRVQAAIVAYETGLAGPGRSDS